MLKRLKKVRNKGHFGGYRDRRHHQSLILNMIMLALNWRQFISNSLLVLNKYHHNHHYQSLVLIILGFPIIFSHFTLIRDMMKVLRRIPI